LLEFLGKKKNTQKGTIDTVRGMKGSGIRKLLQDGNEGWKGDNVPIFPLAEK